MKRLLAILIALGAARAETAGVFNPREFLGLQYRFYVPERMQPGARYPLIVWLHDIAGVGNDNLRQIEDTNDAGSHIWIQPEIQAKHPAFVVAPQCPIGWLWVNFLSRTPSRKLWIAVKLIDAIKREYPIDPDRVYIVGQSMGGYAVWALLGARPNDFAAAIPVAGGGSVSKASQFAGVPVWAFHGRRDPLIPIHESRRMIDALQRAGAHPRITEFERLGHSQSFWREVFRQPELVDWLFAQKRASPRTGHPGGQTAMVTEPSTRSLSETRYGRPVATALKRTHKLWTSLAVKRSAGAN